MLLLRFILVYFWVRSQNNIRTVSDDSNQQSLDQNESSQRLSQELDYLSKGKLYYPPEGQEVIQIQSQYIQGVIDRMERQKQRHGWKENTSFGAAYASGASKTASNAINIQVTLAQFNQKNKLLYFLKDEHFGGLFEYDIETKREKRLLHKQNLFFHDLNLNPEKQQFLCSQYETSGVANITLLECDGSAFQELTGGDTVDSAPAWIPGDESKILFQPSGIAREQEGYVVAHGPASIQMLDRKSRALTVLLEDSKYDFMRPQICRDGNLYFIRRPFELSKYSTGQLFTDVVYFPFRLLRAVFSYLNFFR